MAGELAGARAKLGRANEHLTAFEQGLLAFIEPYTKAKLIHTDFQAPWYVVWSEPIPKPDVRLLLCAGDAVNNLRSSLDYLVCELVLKAGGQPSKATHFPIHLEARHFAQAVKNGGGPLAGLHPKSQAWTLVERSQPYRSPNPVPHALNVIRLLSNADKHRLLLSQASFPRFDDLSWLAWNRGALLVETRIAPLLPVSHVEGTELCRLRFDPAGPDPQVRMNGAVPLSPTIGDSKHQFAFTAIGHAHDHVAGILRDAEALFL